jgi:hypothetical protein
VLQRQVPAVRRLAEVAAAPQKLGDDQVVVFQVLCPAAHVWHEPASPDSASESSPNPVEELAWQQIESRQVKMHASASAHLKRQAANCSFGMHSRFCIRSATSAIVSVGLTTMTKGTPNAVSERGVCMAVKQPQ